MDFDSSDGISVIIPTLNMGEFLVDAIASVQRQTIPVWEIIVIDVDSDDGTYDTVYTLASMDIRIKYHKVPRCSPGVARNIGIRKAKGNIIAFIDADDAWPIDKLQLQYTRLKAEPKVKVIGGFIKYFETLDRKNLIPKSGSRTRTMLNVNVGACLYSREVFDEIGGFDETLHYCEDVDLIQRIREYGIPFTILRHITLFYRKHAKSMIQQPDPRKEIDYKRVSQLSTERKPTCPVPNPPGLKHYLEPIKGKS